MFIKICHPELVSGSINLERQILKQVQYDVEVVLLILRHNIIFA